jgi:hypothetical protein
VSDEQRFSLAGAKAAADGGDDEVARWVGDFLASRGSDNAVLAAALADSPHWWFGPVLVPLAVLERLAGPGDDTLCDVDPHEWRDDVGSMREDVEAGWEPPPLLAEWRDGRLLLQDGNHRHAALGRAGESHAWTLVYFPNLRERDRFAARALEELRVGGSRP